MPGEGMAEEEGVAATVAAVGAVVAADVDAGERGDDDAASGMMGTGPLAGAAAVEDAEGTRGERGEGETEDGVPAGVGSAGVEDGDDAVAGGVRVEAGKVTEEA